SDYNRNGVLVKATTSHHTWRQSIYTVKRAWSDSSTTKTSSALTWQTTICQSQWHEFIAVSVSVTAPEDAYGDDAKGVEDIDA
nr:hypothetical protein [Tanacetum cinerariifolium]